MPLGINASVLMKNIMMESGTARYPKSEKNTLDSKPSQLVYHVFMVTVTYPFTDLSRGRRSSLKPAGSGLVRSRLTQPTPPENEGASPFLYEQKTTCDADEHANAMFGWNQACDQMTPGAFTGKVVEMWIEEMQIFRATANRAVCQSGHFWKNYRVIGVPLEMSSTGLLSRQAITLDSLFTFQSETGFSLSTPEEFDAIAIAIPDSLLENLMVERDLGNFRRLMANTPNALNVLRPDPDKLVELRHYLASILDPRDDHQILRHNPQKQQAIRSMTLEHLLETLRSAQPAPMRTRSFKAHSHLVNEAIELVLSDPSAPPTIKALCDRLKVSQRMLHYSFLDTVGVAPLQYLRNRRLNGVRRDLNRTPSQAIKIHETAARWGFTHLPRFAAEYRALFDELPSSSLKKQSPSIHGSLS